MPIAIETVRRVRDSADILAVIGKKTKLKEHGPVWVGQCPVHWGEVQDLYVNAKRKYFCCFGCNASGSAIDFVMWTEGLSFSDAVWRLEAESQAKQ